MMPRKLMDLICSV